MNCQSESVVRLCVRYAEQLSVFEEFTVLDILGDISVDQISDVHYIILVKNSNYLCCKEMCWVYK